MRLLALVTEAFGGRGGIARYNQDLLTALASCSQLSKIDVLPRYAADCHQVPRPISLKAPVASRIAYIQSAIRHSMTQAPYGAIFCGHIHMLPLAAVLARRRRVPVWLQLHGIEAWQRPGSLIERALASVTLTTAVSRYTRARFLSWADIEPSRVLVLPNTFEPRFSKGPKPEALISRFSCRGRRVLLTVSRLAAGEQYKGHDRVIEALGRVRERIPDVLYLIAGDGDDRARLEQLALRNNVSDAVVFAGYVDESQLVDYYRLADAFVMPSTGEGFGIVFLEAVAAGLPVIAGNRDGSVDALADGALGTLIDPEDPKAIGAAIVDGLSSAAPATGLHLRFSGEHFRKQVDAIVKNCVFRCQLP